MTMRCIVFLSLLCALLQFAAAPPPRRGDQAETKNEAHEEKDELDSLGFEYNRYLKEVVDLLESDPEFKKKLEDAQVADIRNGKIAEELEFVDHKVRTKLDEAKRQELERLRHLAQKQYELTNGIDTDHHFKMSSEHLDHQNPHTFEMEDLKKLIAKASADLVKADEKRRQEFKEYEMQKEFEKQERLRHLEGSEREAFEKQLKENETKHKQHEPLHAPGSKQQLEEVWEKQDHMDNQEFDPKIFFQLHDLDSNGVWDQNEVKTLFLKELDKMYEQGAPEDDMRERAEEMERMREHVFNEADKNKDGLISYDEFLEKTKQPDFEKDPGWESIDQKPVYTYDEYKEFERRRQEEVQRLIDQGLIPPQPVYSQQYGYHAPPVYQHVQPQYPGQGHVPSHGVHQFPSNHPNEHRGQQPMYQNQFHHGNQNHPQQPQQHHQAAQQQHHQQQQAQFHHNQPPHFQPHEQMQQQQQQHHSAQFSQNGHGQQHQQNLHGQRHGQQQQQHHQNVQHHGQFQQQPNVQSPKSQHQQFQQNAHGQQQQEQHFQQNAHGQQQQEQHFQQSQNAHGQQQDQHFQENSQQFQHNQNSQQFHNDQNSQQQHGDGAQLSPQKGDGHEEFGQNYHHNQENEFASRDGFRGQGGNPSHVDPNAIRAEAHAKTGAFQKAHLELDGKEAAKAAAAASSSQSVNNHLK